MVPLPEDACVFVPEGPDEGSQPRQLSGWKCAIQNPVPYGMIGGEKGLLSWMVEKRGATDHTVPYGTDHVCLLPGISCLATFVSSLRDKG